MSKIKQARDLLESIGVEFESPQLDIIEQAIKVEDALGKQQGSKPIFRGDWDTPSNPIVYGRD